MDITEKSRMIATLKYLREVCVVKNKETLNLNDYEWHLFLDEIEECTNIVLNKQAGGVLLEIGKTDEADKSRNFFQEFFLLKSQLERDKSLTLFLGNGNLHMAEHSVYHPLLIKPLEVIFSSEESKIFVKVAEKESMLQINALAGDEFDKSTVHTALEEVAEKDTYPIGKEAETFLYKIANSLSAATEYVEYPDAEKRKSRYIIENRPVIYVGRQKDFAIEYIDKLIELAEKEGALETAFSIAIGANEKSGEISELLIADDEELIKLHPTNTEQKKIMERVCNSLVTLVQGPAGSGKTYEIVNEIGNAISKGWNVLVTGYSSTALRAVEQFIPESLKQLTACLSYGENESVRDVIDNILDYYDRYSPNDIMVKLKQIDSQRQTTKGRIEELEQKCNGLVSDEKIMLDGESFSIVEAGRFLAEHSDVLDLIPGSVSKEFSMSEQELMRLYETNELTEAEISLFKSEVLQELVKPEELESITGKSENINITTLRESIAYLEGFLDQKWMGAAAAEVSTEGSYHLLCSDLETLLDTKNILRTSLQALMYILMKIYQYH